ncbi:MAG: inositol monophosphatase [Elusimicrobia bacterium HGW-Elusimicrobia-1]|jgi:myo-inositol-1(or 4)-monophosphatase|nr:MAG: inositol monophosphatase [Elusimicrobia bacterium HGW-Elusimicrobia-1]
MTLSERLKTSLYSEAAAAVLDGQNVIKKYFERGFKIEYKGDIDPVTIADRETENIIIKRLKNRFPDIGFLCEESCPKEMREGTFWVLDPLDGTVNFVHHCPVFSTSLALFSDGKIVLGIVNDVMRSELFGAVRGRGALLNRKRIRVSGVKTLNRALLVTGFPYYIKERHNRVIKNFKNLVLSAQGIRRLGSAALDLAYTASGRFDGFWEEGLAPWDVAAGSLLVEEAGGRVSDFAGSDDWLFGKMITASNSRIHNSMIKILQQ